MIRTDDPLLTLEDEVEEFTDCIDPDLEELSVVKKYYRGSEIERDGLSEEELEALTDIHEEDVDEFLRDFGRTFIQSFINSMKKSGVLEEDLPTNEPGNIEKRKGVKYVLDHLDLIVKEDLELL